MLNHMVQEPTNQQQIAGTSYDKKQHTVLAKTIHSVSMLQCEPAPCHTSQLQCEGMQVWKAHSFVMRPFCLL